MQYVPDAKLFRPERWSEEEKKKRKGTDLEWLDHSSISSPFGSGARMCMVAVDDD